MQAGSLVDMVIVCTVSLSIVSVFSVEHEASRYSGVSMEVMV